jgi:hypothetical protein
MAALSQLRRLRIKQTAKKYLVRSEDWAAASESFEVAARGGLKQCISLVVRDGTALGANAGRKGQFVIR